MRFLSVYLNRVISETTGPILMGLSLVLVGIVVIADVIG